MWRVEVSRKDESPSKSKLIHSDKLLPPKIITRTGGAEIA